MKKLFGGINLTWKKVIISSILIGIYTAIMAIIPALRYSSFITITTTLEVWIFFGIIIIMNSKSNLDSALKCFVFFLISQPLIYLLQVPFSWQGWRLFQYYKFWGIITIFCLPMGYIGYYLKKGKWWGYFILLPMIIITASSYYGYLLDFTFSYPKYILICLFCIIAMIIYPLYIFKDKKIRIAGITISVILIIATTILSLSNPIVYSTYILGSNKNNKFDTTYKVSLKDKTYGEVKIENIGDGYYSIHANLKKEGKTELILESPKGKKEVYNLIIKRDTYRINKKKSVDKGQEK